MQALDLELESDERRAPLWALTLGLGLVLGCSLPQYATPAPDGEAELDPCSDEACPAGTELPGSDAGASRPDAAAEAGVGELDAGSRGAEPGAGDAAGPPGPEAGDAAVDDAERWKQQLLGTYALRLRS